MSGGTHIHVEYFPIMTDPLMEGHKMKEGVNVKSGNINSGRDTREKRETRNSTWER